MKYDPRAIKLFSQLDINASLLSKLPSTPTKVQTKFLASNFSGLDVFARASPGLGKSTAAAVAVAQKSVGILTSLVLVPTPTLAAQYQSMLQSLGISSRTLYRTGDIQGDQLQHESQNQSVLIGTPQRILDYITFDPSLLPFSLEQLVIDELELFQTPGSKTTPLEQLLGYLLHKHNPTLSLITNTQRKLRFQDLERMLVEQGNRRQLVQVSETTHRPKTTIKVFRHTGEQIDLDSRHFFPHSHGASADHYPKALAQVWDKEALVVVPSSTSTQIHNNGAVITKYNDISGINMNLSNLLLLGWQSDWDLVKLASSVAAGDNPKINICLPSDDNTALENIYAQLEVLDELHEPTSNAGGMAGHGETSGRSQGN